MNRIIQLLILTVLSFASLSAQSTEPSFVLNGKSFGDSVVLRWAPLTFTAWQQHLAGFKLWREDPSGGERLLIGTVQERTLEQWQIRLNGRDAEDWSVRYGAIAAQMRYGDGLNASFDGGPAANIIDLSDEQASRLSYALLAADLSSDAATGLGFRLVDHTVETGRSYRYVLEDNSSATGAPLAAAVVNSTGYVTLPQLPALRIEEQDQLLELRADLRLLSIDFTAYLIERSTEPSGPYSVITTSPLLLFTEDGNHELVYYDRLPENDRTYYYRLIGLGPFGDRSLPSPTSSGTGRDRTLAEHPVVTTVEGTQRQVELTWEMPPVADLAGFWVGRSEAKDGPFRLCHQDILPASQRNFTDTEPGGWDRNFYHVIAVDQAGNMSVSPARYVAIEDQEPPATPINLKGAADSSGYVLLRWDAVPGNDLLGYNLYYANDPTHEFSPLNAYPIPRNYFVDSISTKVLNREVYYRIAAVDKHYNQSALSATLAVARVHDFQLLPPVISAVESDAKGITLSWIASSHPLVAGYKVFARSQGSAEWALQAVIDDPLVTQHYFQLAEGQYLLSLRAFSQTAQESDYALGIKAIVRDPLLPLPNQLELSQTAEGIVFSWQAGSTMGFDAMIYRSVNFAPMQSIGRLQANTGRFVDKAIEDDGVYRYWIRLQDNDGKRSPFSQPLQIEVEE